ncbi:MAG: cytochrome P460 family protein [Bryobacteraceae bacterium]
MIKPILCVAGCLAVMAVLAISRPASEAMSDGPQYTAGGQLRFPNDYRQWVFLSSGLGMTYGPAATAAHEDPRFDNVFVNRSAYKSFLASGRWPDKTIFILEVRESQSKGSINQGGHFQTGVAAIEAHVKEEKRFAGGWAFFGFESGKGPAKQIPFSASCYSCHRDHGAVDTTFVQFYPTLLDAAKANHTLQ